MPSDTAKERKKNKKSTVKSIVKAKKSQLAGIMGSITGRRKKTVAKKKTKSKGRKK